MIDSLMPYVDRVTNLAPGFGQKEAVIFTGALIAETLVRALAKKKPKQLAALEPLKHIEFYASFAKNPFYSHSFSHKLKAHLALLPSSIWGISLISKMTGIKMERPLAGDHDVMKIDLIATDRLPLVCFLACAGETLKIAGKIVGSLATGVVAEKMATGQTEGKIRFAVSAALLALSAWNVKTVVGKKNSNISRINN